MPPKSYVIFQATKDMSNADVLRAGTAKAKRLIENHIINQILIPGAQALIQNAVQGRISLGHNMTGNTINSYAAGVYANGKLVQIETPSGSIPGPLRHKLNAGQKFGAGRQRWDGDIQEKPFTAVISTNGSTEPERSIAFLQSYRPDSPGFALVVTNGVEYATYQEAEMQIDTLTANFDYTKMFIPSMFKPMSS